MDGNQESKNGKKSFAEMLEESLKDGGSMEGKVTTGTVIGFNNDKAVIDVGLKAEGRLFIADIKTLKGSEEVLIGDTLSVYIERLEDRNGEPVLSIEKAKKEAVWTNLEKHMLDGTPVKGEITGRTRGGFSVEINDMPTFLPGSQVDLRIVKDITPLLNVEQPFKILKMDRVRNNIVVSRRAVLEASRQEARKVVMSELEEGMIRDGVARNITEYGVFVDIGGVDGLLHVTDMAWKRVTNPADIVAVGDTLKVQILKLNVETGRVSLGMKQLVQTPWEGIEQRYIVGEKYKGKVVNLTDYGAFVELEDCIEGMIFMAELSWNKKNIHPNKVLNPGEEVEVMVLDVNPAKRKISLGLKQCQENPWKKFAENNPVGTKITGIVKNITEFGIFVCVDGELDGMIFTSDLSLVANSSDSRIRNISKGNEIEVVVRDINPEKERISLELAQTAEDKLRAEAVMNIRKGDVVNAEIVALHANGFDVKLECGALGFVKRSDISNDRDKHRQDAVSVGEKITAIVLDVDRSKCVNLSVRVLEARLEKEALQQFGKSDNGASLGDILGAAISAKEDSQKGR
jgi:small subunit ribosomal protein S1